MEENTYPTIFSTVTAVNGKDFAIQITGLAEASCTYNSTVGLRTNRNARYDYVQYGHSMYNFTPEELSRAR